MSIVTPLPQGTIVKLYSGVAWDNTYSDVRLFDNESQRGAYLAPLELSTWTACSVVDYGKAIRLQSNNFNRMLTADYMYFINNALEGSMEKGFYAFVTDVSYVNVNTIEVRYEIDWIQTYLFELEIGESLVEREHVNDDTYGLNTIEEGLDTGEYVIASQLRWTDAPAIITGVLTDNTQARNVQNMVTCIATAVFSIDNLGTLNDYLNTFNDTPERVVLLCMGTVDMMEAGGAPKFFSKSHSVNRPNYFGFNGRSYTPVNNKMLCYPYTFVTVDNFQGELEQYRWENFKSTTASFGHIGSAIPKPSMEIFPIDYMGATASSISVNTAQQMTVTYTNFPVVPYANDAFRAWVSQYGGSATVQAAASVVGVGTSLAMAVSASNPATMIGGALAATGSAMSLNRQAQEYREHRIHNVQMHNGVSSAGLSYARNEVGFRCTVYTIRPEYAKRIDEFFSRYGYKVDAVKQPNIRGRQVVNYVKCAKCVVNGNAPVEARNCLERALLQGVSFWHTNNIGSNVGANAIVG